MKLTELEAVFIGGFDITTGGWRELPDIRGAQGVMFTCPLCQGHQILVPVANPRGAEVIPVTAFPGITFRWTMSGETLATLTLMPSVDLSKSGEGCRWHGFVKDGDAA